MMNLKTSQGTKDYLLQVSGCKKKKKVKPSGPFQHFSHSTSKVPGKKFLKIVYFSAKTLKSIDTHAIMA